MVWDTPVTFTYKVCFFVWRRPVTVVLPSAASDSAIVADTAVTVKWSAFVTSFPLIVTLSVAVPADSPAGELHFIWVLLTRVTPVHAWPPMVAATVCVPGEAAVGKSVPVMVTSRPATV